MMTGLYFNRSLIILFLSFVSFLAIGLGGSNAVANDTQDEFALFETAPKKKPVKKTESKKAPDAKPAPTATPTPPVATPTATPSAPEAAPPVPAKAEAEPAKAPVVSTDKFEQLKAEIRKNPKDGKLITDLAEELFKRKEYEKVTLLLWKHIDKIDRRGIILLTKAHEQRNEPAEMMRALNVELGKDDKDFEAYTLMAKAYAIQRKSKEAMENYKKAVELNPKYEPAYDGLIELYQKREPPNLYELRILFQDMIANIGPRPQYLRKLCEINTMDGTYDAAITTCKEAIAKDTKVADPFVYLGVSQRANGDDAIALQTLKKAALDFPKAEIAQYYYGRLLEEQKNYVDAMRFYKAGTEADSQAARSWLGLATSSFEIRKYELSLIAYKNACKYDKKNAVAFRKATSILRNAKNGQWIDKFESASDTCTF
ncbi:tetratricopeptide repeat protein [Bdellovibrio reynosensis]|uniref:O-linked GlcNAc transferase n=1 Tax=Bdellovibrio reynosensis TaxID=2835041 RepID=A0ABY4C6P2_9BACT|nr:tetratricopeptide repeat protein [Bdellovibrio reynosensis]UOF00469.1 O-linked GlcNAc transferase [Bdellovibrio reynosensis]